MGLAPFDEIYANNALLGDIGVEKNMGNLSGNEPAVNRLEHLGSFKSAWNIFQADVKLPKCRIKVMTLLSHKKEVS